MTTDVVHEDIALPSLADAVANSENILRSRSAIETDQNRSHRRDKLCGTQNSTGSQESTMGFDKKRDDYKSLISCCSCSRNSGQCLTLRNILDSFKAPLSEEQAWALIYQFVSLYKMASIKQHHLFNEFEMPDSLENLCLHRDGTVHCTWPERQRLQATELLQTSGQEAGSPQTPFPVIKSDGE